MAGRGTVDHGVNSDLLDPDRIRQVLRELELGDPDRRGFAEAVSAFCATVREVPGEPVRTWAVGDHRVRAASRDRVRAKDVVCSCGSRQCAHAGAVLVVLAYQDPVRGAALRAPAWEVALAPLSPGPAVPERAGRRYRWVRYDIQRPRAGASGLDVQPVLVPDPSVPNLSPARYPRALSALRAAVQDLRPADRELHPAWHALQRARQLERGKRADTTRHLSRALLEPLSRAREVTLEGRAITVVAQPLQPRLVAQHREGGGLTLTFAEPLQYHWRNVGIVLSRAGELRPLAAELPQALVERLMDPLPAVPAADVEAFVDRLVVSRGLEVDLPEDIPLVRRADRKEARITLEEVPGHCLEVRLEFVYGRRGSEAVLGPNTDAPHAKVPEQGLVRRDQAWEQAEAQRFEADLGFADQRIFAFDPALVFLEEVLPALTDRWAIYGRDALVRLKVQGTFAPVVEFTEGEDWFDLDVGFELEGRSVDAVEVLQSWLDGSRYHRLDDGSLARLPTALARRSTPARWTCCSRCARPSAASEAGTRGWPRSCSTGWGLPRLAGSPGPARWPPSARGSR